MGKLTLRNLLTDSITFIKLLFSINFKCNFIKFIMSTIYLNNILLMHKLRIY